MTVAVKKIRTLLQNKKFLAIFLYALSILLWLFRGVFFLVCDAGLPTVPLNPAGAALVNASLISGGLYSTDGADPQMIFYGVNIPVRTVQLNADFSGPAGEMELFYSRKEGQPLSLRRRVLGVPQNGGSVLYSLPPGTVRTLRLDPGSAGSNRVTIDSIILNPPQPVWRYFVPSLRGFMALLVLPALALCLICTIIEVVMPLFGVSAHTAGEG